MNSGAPLAPIRIDRIEKPEHALNKGEIYLYVYFSARRQMLLFGLEHYCEGQNTAEFLAVFLD